MSVHEFNNRIEAQRAILKVVNSHRWESEPLVGLSRNAIDRWIGLNGLDPRSRLVELLLDASAKLFFLANRSQEQVSEEYRTVSENISRICGELVCELRTTS